MNFNELESAVKHLRETCKCLQCGAKFKKADVHIIATTSTEGLFELKCKKCLSTTIVTVTSGGTDEVEITDQKLPSETIPTTRGRRSLVSQNDVLDVKNFLSNFDGNFKKIFPKK